MWKSLFFGLIALELVFAGLAGYKVKTIMKAMEDGPKMAPPPPSVTTVVVKGEPWQPSINAVGSLKAVNGVEVSADLPGIVAEIAFQSGATVKKGDLIVRLDTRQEEAQLRSAQARQQLSTLNLKRQSDLIAKKATSQSEYDAAAAAARQDEAAVEEAKALIARKTIVAPFDGVLGIRKVDLGQYLKGGDPIVSLQSVNPILVQFALPQAGINQIALGKRIAVTAAGAGDEAFEGTITAINSKIDETSRNLTIEAEVHNESQKLRAGMFADVRVFLPEEPNVLLLPATAVNYAPYGNSVFVVASGTAPGSHIVEQHFVKLGATRGDQVAVLSGLKEGDEVVTSGVFKLRGQSPVTVAPGAPKVPQPVRLNNSVQPGNEAQPKPPEA
jgi:membrane fusion protein (multidrug efflux system)